MEEDLSQQIREVANNILSVGALGIRLTTGSIRLAFSTALFIFTCGSAVRWRRNPDLQPPSQDAQQSDQEDSDSGSSARYHYRNEMSRTIPKTPSRDELNKLISIHELTRKLSADEKNPQREDIVIIPSLSLDASELQKIPAVHHYEERQLCTLFYLRNPNVRLVYVTSMPVDQAIVQYYLKLIEQTSMVTAVDAYKRLLILSCNDSSLIPLTSKILRRPRLMQKIRSFINPKLGYLVCFISSNLERELALKLQIPLFSNDPSLNYWGTKSGSREIFEEAGVPLANGTDLAHTPDDLSVLIEELYNKRSQQIEKIVVKLNIGFSGEGNSILRCSHFDKSNLLPSIRYSLEHKLEYTYEGETWKTFCEKLELYGAIAEEWVPNVIESPSCQAMINMNREVELLSTHEQMLRNGVVYIGCKFPANEDYREMLLEYTLKVGEALERRGCRERFAVDYVITKDANGKCEAYAIEINLRWGGTSHPMVFAQNLTDSELTRDGRLLSRDGQHKYYIATDNVKDDNFTGLNPEDFLEFINYYPELQFSPDTLTGVVFHLLAAIPVYGKFGFVAIGNSLEEAEQLYDAALATLHREVVELAKQKYYAELDLTIVRPNKK